MHYQKKFAESLESFSLANDNAADKGQGMCKCWDIFVEFLNFHMCRRNDWLLKIFLFLLDIKDGNIFKK
jgi:hypothetical protein